MSSALTLKVHHPSTHTTRRIPLPSHAQDWPILRNLLVERFGLPSEEQEGLQVRWEDEEGDLLSISSEVELQEMLQLVDRTKAVRLILDTQAQKHGQAHPDSASSIATAHASQSGETHQDAQQAPEGYVPVASDVSIRAAALAAEYAFAAEIEAERACREGQQKAAEMEERLLAELERGLPSKEGVLKTLPELQAIDTASESAVNEVERDPIELWSEESDTEDEEDGESDTTHVTKIEGKGKGRALDADADVEVEDPVEEALPFGPEIPAATNHRNENTSPAAEDPAEPSLPSSASFAANSNLNPALSLLEQHLSSLNLSALFSSLPASVLPVTSPLQSLFASPSNLLDPAKMQQFGAEIQRGVGELVGKVREEAEEQRRAFERETERIRAEVEQRREAERHGADAAAQEKTPATQSEQQKEADEAKRKEKEREVARAQRRLATEQGSTRTRPGAARRVVNEVRKHADRVEPTAEAQPITEASPGPPAKSPNVSLPSDDMYNRRLSSMPGSFNPFLQPNPYYYYRDTPAEMGSSFPTPRSSTLPGSFPSGSTSQTAPLPIASSSRLSPEDGWSEVTPAALKKKVVELGFSMDDLGTRIAAERVWEQNRGQPLEWMVGKVVGMLVK